KSTFEKYQQSSEEVLEKKSTALSGMVHPLREALNQVNEKVTELERARHTAYGGVTELMRQISQAHQQLQQETANLSKAMRIPTTRGRWGEIQLRRVVELAGMVAHCDFSEQPYESNESGRFRPDLVVHLPNHRQVVVDAKAPLQAYLESVDASDEQMRLEKLREHAKQVRARIRDLSSKNYWNQFKPAPEFVVLFLPSESFFSAAVEQDHTLIEYGVEQQVILATPTTLISLLRAVSQGWKEEGVAENAQKICDLGKQLYDRMSVLINHFNELRKGLNRAVEAYNKTTISFEERITVTARRLKELHVGKSEELPDTATIDIHAREWSKPDCLGLEELDTELVVSSGTEKC
ncbi:MAG: DNA recombination protein RmuC, partial [Chlamydiia bacterium]|nr:DNA recombination protein RmuC [Chlamydiia bacterium]